MTIEVISFDTFPPLVSRKVIAKFTLKRLEIDYFRVMKTSEAWSNKRRRIYLEIHWYFQKTDQEIIEKYLFLKNVSSQISFLKL